MKDLRALLIDPELVREVPIILASAGVRLVFVESLPNSKIDGVCTWLSEEEPVIALSLRYDRLDNFWFVLRHEIEHVLRGDGKDLAVIDDLDVEEGSALPPEEVAAFSSVAEVHPAIVVGQIQRQLKKYSFLRKYLVPVRKFIMQESIVDGWGVVAPSEL